MRVTVLGCGGSGGVPLIGGDWGDCDPRDPRNRRRRPSVLVKGGNAVILVDTGPDLREQLLDAGVRWVDAVLWTHAHADHTHGIDDLRGLNWVMRRHVDGWADERTLASLRHRFGYCFTDQPAGMFHRPAIVPHLIEGAAFRIKDQEVVPFVQDHGYSMSLGFRFGPFAYSTDVVDFDEEAFAILEGIEVWIVDCTRVSPPHPVHAHLERTLSWIERLRPRRTYLTHMNHTMDYETVKALCPPGVLPAHDGLVIEV